MAPLVGPWPSLLTLPIYKIVGNIFDDMLMIYNVALFYWYVQ